MVFERKIIMNIFGPVKDEQSGSREQTNIMSKRVSTRNKTYWTQSEAEDYTMGLDTRGKAITHFHTRGHERELCSITMSELEIPFGIKEMFRVTEYGGPDWKQEQLIGKF